MDTYTALGWLGNASSWKQWLKLYSKNMVKWAADCTFEQEKINLDWFKKCIMLETLDEVDIRLTKGIKPSVGSVML